jgi:hypothetical protein
MLFARITQVHMHPDGIDIGCSAVMPVSNGTLLLGSEPCTARVVLAMISPFVVYPDYAPE